MFARKWFVSFCYFCGGDATITILTTSVLLPWCFAFNNCFYFCYLWRLNSRFVFLERSLDPKIEFFLIFVLIATAMNRCTSVFLLCFWFFFFYTMNRCSDPVPKQFKVRTPAGHTFQGSLNCQRLHCWCNRCLIHTVWLESQKIFFFFCLHPHIPLTFADSQI
jgi:hypothetical protein